MIFCLLVCAVCVQAQNGIVKTYYPNGTIESELSFVDDVYDGTSYWYYSNGNIKEEKIFSNGKLNGWIRCYYESGLVKEESLIKDGIKDGLHKQYYENGGLKTVRSYDAGRLIKKIELDFDTSYQAPVEAYEAGNRQYVIQEKKQELLCDVEICPIPINGLQAIQDSLLYPEHALLYGLEGVVTLVATINEKGEVENSEIIQGLGLGCDDAAKEAVKKNKFLPGQQNSKAVRSHITLSVGFWLDEKSKLAYQRTQIDTRRFAVEQQETSMTESKQERQTAVSVVDSGGKIDKTNFTCDLEECPYPVGGLSAVLEKLIVPDVAKRVGLKGEVIIRATVDEEGFVRDTKVLKGMGHGCSESAEVAILESKFYPGKIDGEAVRADVDITIPIGR
ncbi:MAG: hypothetical protein A2V66_05950 [Ignavibacteria bacterium RBG_13_36_8]|nr:MAG: hypothetical protein A2V66_05950 [Ignavibacteria bacterium RBG_13_36_8]